MPQEQLQPHTGKGRRPALAYCSTAACLVLHRTSGRQRTVCTRRHVPGGSCERAWLCSRIMAAFSLSAAEPCTAEFTAARSSFDCRPVRAHSQVNPCRGAFHVMSF